MQIWNHVKQIYPGHWRFKTRNLSKCGMRSTRGDYLARKENAKISVWVKQSKSEKELILLTYMTYILPIQPTLFLRISYVVHIHISIRCDIIHSFPLIRIGGKLHWLREATLAKPHSTKCKSKLQFQYFIQCNFQHVSLSEFSVCIQRWHLHEWTFA